MTDVLFESDVLFETQHVSENIFKHYNFLIVSVQCFNTSPNLMMLYRKKWRPFFSGHWLKTEFVCILKRRPNVQDQITHEFLAVPKFLLNVLKRYHYRKKWR